MISLFCRPWAGASANARVERRVPPALLRLLDAAIFLMVLFLFLLNVLLISILLGVFLFLIPIGWSAA